MYPYFRTIDPRELRLPSSRRRADPGKFARQLSKYGKSDKGMPPILVYECSDGVFVIYNGVTRATRIAHLAPGILVTIEVAGLIRQLGSQEPKVGDAPP